MRLLLSMLRDGILAGIVCICFWAALGGVLDSAAAPLSDPAVDRFNLRVGTQTFGPRYQFTAESSLVETARAIQEMGSDAIKFYLGRHYRRQYGIGLSPTIANLAALARAEPSCRAVLEMPFRHYLLWTYCLTVPGDAYWKDGLTGNERRREYGEMRELTSYLLRQYNQSGKSFYLGHWEGDWYLLPSYNTATNPSPAAIQGMIEWLNIRQQAVDDARRFTPHTNVQVYLYAEVNRVRDAMRNLPGRNRRLVNCVLPAVTNLDYVSWSSYDGQNLHASELFKTLDYIEAHLPTNKATRIQGKRVFVGEYGWGATLSSAAQEPPTRNYLQKLLQWGCPFILFWEMYDNEGKRYWLIDKDGEKTPCYELHQRFYNLARLRVGAFKPETGRLPTAGDFANRVAPALNDPLPEPIRLTVRNGPVQVVSAEAARVGGTVEQGVYGDDQAKVILHWGPRDGGTRTDQWQQHEVLGLNTRFGEVRFDAVLQPLRSEGRYHFRFQATNASGQAWAPATASFTHRFQPGPR